MDAATERQSNGLSQPARRFDWSGLTARNSHQIHQRLPEPGRAAHRKRERYLAKECVGSNRALTRTIATSRSDDNLERVKPAPNEGTHLEEPRADSNRRLRTALSVCSKTNGNRLDLTNSFRKVAPASAAPRRPVPAPDFPPLGAGLPTPLSPAFAGGGRRRFPWLPG